MARNVLGNNPQRAGDDIIVMGTINSAKNIILNNGVKLYIKNASGDLYSSITTDSSNNLVITNDNYAGDLIVLAARMSDAATQRFLAWGEDGTSLLPRLWIQSDVKFDITGALTIDTDDGLFVTPYTRHIQIPAVLTGNPANQPTAVDFYTTGGLQFGTTGAKYAFFQWELPDDWDGTDVYVEVDWFPDSAAMAGTDTVQWTIEYRCTAEGEVYGTGTSKTLTLTNSDDNARYLSIHSRGTMPYDDANQPLTKQDHIYFKVSRNTAVANDFGGSVTVPAFEIIYNSNQIPRGN